MIYIVRGSEKAAKYMIGCSIAQFLTAQPVKIDGLIVTPSRSNDGNVYKIKRGNRVLYKANKVDWTEEFDSIKEKAKKETCAVANTPDNIEFKYGPKTPTNLRTYDRIVDSIEEQLVDNRDVVIVANIYGAYLEDFKAEMMRNHQQKVTTIEIMRDPVNSFLMDTNRNFVIDKWNEDECKNFMLFDNLHFLKAFEDDVDVRMRYEDVIETGTFDLNGLTVKLNKKLKRVDATTPGLNDWEEMNITQNRIMKVGLLVDIITTRFDAYVNKPSEIPADIAGYFGYTY